MVESGIITRDVEQFVNINLKLDTTNAINIEESLDKLISSNVIMMLSEDGQQSIIKLQESLEACLVSYQNDYNEYGEYEGKIDE